MTSDMELRVAGVTFAPGYPDNLTRLHALIEDRKADSLGWHAPGDVVSEPSGDVEDARLPIVLRRNPANEYDENAIEVHVPALGRRGMIGHIPATIAARLAPSLDRGDVWKAVLVNVMIDPDHPDRPGALVNIECINRVTQDA